MSGVPVETRNTNEYSSSQIRTAKEEVSRILNLGLEIQTAADYAGVRASVVKVWMDTDPDFKMKCAQSTARAVVSVTARLMKLVRDGNTKAIFFWLRQRTEEFRDRANIRVESTEDQARDIAAALQAFTDATARPSKTVEPMSISRN